MYKETQTYTFVQHCCLWIYLKQIARMSLCISNLNSFFQAGFNKPLLTPRSEEIDLLSHQQEHDIERMKMFVQLRQYLERVRKLNFLRERHEAVLSHFHWVVATSTTVLFLEFWLQLD